jgi:hypothetical protein
MAETDNIDIALNLENCNNYLNLYNWISEGNDDKNTLIGIHLNIRSIRKNWDQFVSYISNGFNKVSIIVLTETFLIDNEEHKYEIRGYNQFVKNRNKNGNRWGRNYCLC